MDNDDKDALCAMIMRLANDHNFNARTLLDASSSLQAYAESHLALGLFEAVEIIRNYGLRTAEILPLRGME